MTAGIVFAASSLQLQAWYEKVAQEQNNKNKERLGGTGLSEKDKADFKFVWEDRDVRDCLHNRLHNKARKCAAHKQLVLLLAAVWHTVSMSYYVGAMQDERWADLSSASLHGSHMPCSCVLCHVAVHAVCWRVAK